MFVVIDTNVLVSALLNPYGKPAAVLSLVLDEKVHICYDSRIIAEYIDVLNRPKFNLTAKEVDELIDFLKHSGNSCTASSEKVKSTHADDMPFAQVCLSIEAEYLITGNTGHFPKRFARTSVVTPSSFLEKFYSGK
jgi:putative PIN family toxin of toxin-antitoxin system